MFPFPPRFLLVVALAAAWTAVVGGPALGQSAAYTDVSGNAHVAAIDAITEAAIAEGCAPDRFCPDELVRRDQMASFLARSLGLDEVVGARFSDVPEDNVHRGAINALADAGITVGCAGGRFCPDDSISRAQMASFLDRAFDLGPSDDQYFFDVGDTHGPSAQRVAEAGISVGCDGLGLQFCPTDSVPRDQMASFLARAVDLVPSVSIPILIEPGDDGPAVESLQSRLRSLGYTVTDADGRYGSGTTDAVRAFQLVHDLQVDGIYGPGTRAAMAAPQSPSSVVGSFTTPLVPGEDRNNNIHRAADLIDGDVIAPGASYSLDDAIGPRTRERGFGPNGYIDDDGEIISVVGGGISQMGTTFLNASWFAGIELVDFRQHTIYFERYPMCREATLARNLLDVVVVNDTPYPLTVATSYTSESVTVSLVGAPWATVEGWIGDPYAVEGPGGAFSIDCGRTVTHPDGSDSSQQYTWRYHEGYPG